MTPYRASFDNGRHLAAARVMAGLSQKELAALAGIHVNNIKRLEIMEQISGSAHSIECIGKALAEKGIMAERWPMPYVRCA